MKHIRPFSDKFWAYAESAFEYRINCINGESGLGKNTISVLMFLELLRTQAKNGGKFIITGHSLSHVCSVLSTVLGLEGVYERSRSIGYGVHEFRLYGYTVYLGSLRNVAKWVSTVSCWLALNICNDCNVSDFRAILGACNDTCTIFISGYVLGDASPIKMLLRENNANIWEMSRDDALKHITFEAED